MRGLVAGLARRHRHARSYAALAELAVQEDSPFLRFGNPEPQTFNHLQALGQIPETKVRPNTAVSLRALSIAMAPMAGYVCLHLLYPGSADLVPASALLTE